MNEGAGAFLFRHRGWVPVFPILFVLVFASPRSGWWQGGLVAMSCGEAMRLWAAAHLGRTTRSSRPRAGKLVTSGPFAHTRHPLYLGNLLLTLGFAVASGAGFPWFPLVVLAAFLLLYRGHARREERVLAEAFPEVWAAYRREVPSPGWRLRGARVGGAGDPGLPTWKRALSVEALTLNAEFWLLAGLGARVRWLP